MKVAGFVISLDRSTARRAQVDRILHACPIPCARLSAVDGAKLSPAERAAVYAPRILRPRYPFSISNAEIGCFLSHRQVWQKLLDDGLDAALILEDDVELEAGFDSSLSFAIKFAQPGDYVQFQTREMGERHRSLASENGRSLLAPVVAPRRTSAQLVTKEAAKRLLETSRRFDRPVDGFLQMSWVTHVPVRVVVPSCMREVSAAAGGSTISHGRKTFRERIFLEVYRPMYRTSITLRSHFQSRYLR